MPQPTVVKKVCMVGAGYVGLPMALILAESGRQVVAVDINTTIVNAINSGVLHIQVSAAGEGEAKAGEGRIHRIYVHCTHALPCAHLAQPSLLCPVMCQ